MGVSISRPPRCERGALPAELIALEALNLSVLSGSHTRQTQALTVEISDGARWATLLETNDLSDHEPITRSTLNLDGKPVGADLNA